MLIYSNTTSSFIKRTTLMLKEILIDELGIAVNRSRFVYNGSRVPFQIVVFEDKTKLGYFDSLIYQIGLNKRLMYSAKSSVIKDILRHELMHLFTKLDFGSVERPHGTEFKTTCDKFGLSSEIKKATINLEDANDSIEGDIASERVIEKVKKLLKLSSSSNEHESQLATAKANQLLFKHNLSNINSSSQEDDIVVYVERVMEGKKVTGKANAIYHILKHFFVTPLFSHGTGGFYLEAIGKKENVLLAEYVAAFLNVELDRLWDQARKENKELRGISAKNSFYSGISQGYIQKISTSQKEVATANDMTLIDSSLKRQLQYVHGLRTKTTTTKGKFCHDSYESGKKAGENLNINPAMSSSQKSKIFALDFLK